MKFHSSRFGEFEFKQENVIYFPFGIPGFDNMKRYILLTKENIPFFYFLHSIEDENLTFILTNPYFFLKDYSFKLSNEDIYFLEIDDIDKLGKEIFVFSIVTIKEKTKKFSLNLKAPVIINLEKKIGKQVKCPMKYINKSKMKKGKILEYMAQISLI